MTTTTPSTPVEIHIHQWCYQYDALLNDTQPRRVEWCTACGTTRMLLESGWWYQVPDLARPLLKRCREIDHHKKQPRPGSRLGRGLQDLQTLPTIGMGSLQWAWPKPPK